MANNEEAAQEINPTPLLVGGERCLSVPVFLIF
jgi:hypothetical protein